MKYNICMLSVIFTITGIDYENTIKTIFPDVLPRILESDSDNLIIKLIRQLGEDALPVITELTGRMSDTIKNEILTGCINAYSQEIKQEINNYFADNDWGNCYVSGTITASCTSSICLIIKSIIIDYNYLLSKYEHSIEHLGRFKKYIMQAGSLLPLKWLDRMLIRLYWNDTIKHQLLSMIKSGLDDRGISIDITDMTLLYSDESDTAKAVSENRPFVMTEMMEEEIICAVADYLKNKNNIPSVP